MTTDSWTSTGAVVRAAAVTLAAGAVVTGLGALVEGSTASYAALLGTGLAVVVFTFGSLAVDYVAQHLPAASLVFALLTYTFQLVLMALAFAVVTRAGWLDDELRRGWLGGAIITCALVWTVAQVRLLTTARIPVYDQVGPRREGGAG